MGEVVRFSPLPPDLPDVLEDSWDEDERTCAAALRLVRDNLIVAGISFVAGMLSLAVRAVIIASIWR